eukprot:68500-Chlamydomonas_euryale.AAC.1
MSTYPLGRRSTNRYKGVKGGMGTGEGGKSGKTVREGVALRHTCGRYSTARVEVTKRVREWRKGGGEGGPSWMDNGWMVGGVGGG